MGKVAPYVTRFRELVGVIRNMSEEDKYRAFMKGLKPNIRQMVGPNVRGDLEAAILMAEQFDLYGQSEFSGIRKSTRWIWSREHQGVKSKTNKKGQCTWWSRHRQHPRHPVRWLWWMAKGRAKGKSHHKTKKAKAKGRGTRAMSVVSAVEGHT